LLGTTESERRGTQEPDLASAARTKLKARAQEL
jgi:hypothetical protein